MKYSRSAITMLTAQYRSVLKKCLLINLGLYALGAVAIAPANAETNVVVGGTYDSTYGTIKEGTSTDLDTKYQDKLTSSSDITVNSVSGGTSGNNDYFKLEDTGSYSSLTLGKGDNLVTATSENNGTLHIGKAGASNNSVDITGANRGTIQVGTGTNGVNITGNNGGNINIGNGSIVLDGNTKKITVNGSEVTTLAAVKTAAQSTDEDSLGKYLSDTYQTKISDTNKIQMSNVEGLGTISSAASTDYITKDFENITTAGETAVKNLAQTQIEADLAASGSKIKAAISDVTGDLNNLSTTKDNLVAAINENYNHIGTVDEDLGELQDKVSELKNVVGNDDSGLVQDVNTLKGDSSVTGSVDNKISTALTGYVQKDGDKVLSTNDYTTADKEKLAGIAAGADENVIETIKVNGTALTVTDKAVDISVPTKTSDLINDSNYTTMSAVEGKGYQTSDQVASAINAKTAGMATESWVEGKGYQTSDQVASAINTATNGMATKTWVGEQGYQTSDQVASAINTKTAGMATQSWVEGKGYQTSDQVTSAINAKTAGMATESWVEGKGYQTSTQVSDAITGAVNGLDATVEKTAGTDGLAIKITQENGKLTGITASIAENTYDAYGAADAVNEKLGGSFSSTNTVAAALDKKVDAVEGKGLSSNDYTTAEKTKLDGIAEGADANVIETIKVNGEALTVTDKTVNITAVQKVETGTTNGTIKVDDTEVSVAGLKGAAYKDVATAVEADNANLVTSGAVNTAITGAVNALDATVTKEAGTDGLAIEITQTDGKLTAITASIADGTYVKSVTAGDNNGQIKVDGANISVTGLKDAAYKDVATAVEAGNANLVTSGAVNTAINNATENLADKNLSNITADGKDVIKQQAQVQIDADIAKANGSINTAINGAISNAISHNATTKEINFKIGASEFTAYDKAGADAAISNAIDGAISYNTTTGIYTLKNSSGQGQVYDTATTDAQILATAEGGKYTGAQVNGTTGDTTIKGALAATNAQVDTNTAAIKLLNDDDTKVGSVKNSIKTLAETATYSAVTGAKDLTANSTIAGALQTLDANKASTAKENTFTAINNFEQGITIGDGTQDHAKTTITADKNGISIDKDLSVEGDFDIKGDIAVADEQGNKKLVVEGATGDVTTVGTISVLSDIDDPTKAVFKVDTDGSIRAANGEFVVDKDGNTKIKGALAAGKTGAEFAVGSDGNISAAKGKFTVDTDGKIVATGLDAGAGTIKTTGAIEGGSATITGALSAGGNKFNVADTGNVTVGDTDKYVKINTDGTLETSGDAVVGGELTANSLAVVENAEIGGELKVTGVSKLNGGINVNDKMSVDTNGNIIAQNVTGTSLNISGDSYLHNTSVDGTLNVSGASYLQSTDVNGTLNVKDAAYLHNTSVDGTLNVSGASYLQSTDVNGTLNVKDAAYLHNTSVDGTLNVSGDSYLHSTNVEGTLDVTDKATAKEFANTNNTFSADENGNVTAQSLTFNGDTSKMVNAIDIEKVLDGAGDANTIATTASLGKTIGNFDTLGKDNYNLTDDAQNMPTTVVEALNNIDARIGKVHGLAKDLGENYNGNLYDGTTIAQHLTAIDASIGNRTTTYKNTNGSNGYTATAGADVAAITAEIASNIGTAADLGAAMNGVSARNTVNTNIANLNSSIGDVSELRNTHYAYNSTNLTDAVKAVDTGLYNLDQDVRSLRHHFEAGMASAAALSALQPNARASGNTQLAIGTGAYRGHNAYAIGGFHWVTDNILLNAGVAYDNSEATYRMGVTYSW